jgi:hypothetical protein
MSVTMTLPRLAFVCMLLGALLTGTIAIRAQAPITPPVPGPEQPIPYSHKTHVSRGLECRMCHVNPDDGKLMTFPATATCMGCHKTIAADRPAIQKLTALAASGTPIPWVRVYQMPDYVYWKHGTHLKAGVTCVECHGAVGEHDVTTRETNVSTMIGCVDCHNKKQAFTDCGDCHAPRQ